MPDDLRHLNHLLVIGHSAPESFHRPGRGSPKVRPIEDRVAHGQARRDELRSVLSAALEQQNDAVDDLSVEELRALGSVVTLDGDDPTYPLRVDSLQRHSRHRDPRPQWLLLGVQSDSQGRERAV